MPPLCSHRFRANDAQSYTVRRRRLGPRCNDERETLAELNAGLVRNGNLFEQKRGHHDDEKEYNLLFGGDDGDRVQNMVNFERFDPLSQPPRRRGETGIKACPKGGEGTMSDATRLCSIAQKSPPSNVQGKTKQDRRDRSAYGLHQTQRPRRSWLACWAR